MHRHTLASAALAISSTACPPLARGGTSQPDRPAPTILAVSATGEARAAPDMASFTAGVRTQALDAREAQNASAAKMTAVIVALTRAGIAAPDLQTFGLTLSPQYATPPDQPQRLTGYVASASVHVKVHALQRLAQVIDASSEAGADEVDGVTFGLADPDKTQDEARRDAVRRLHAEADVYAEAAGLRLGRLVTLTADTVDLPVRPSAYRMQEVMMTKNATPIAPGELTVRAQVTATYELQR